MNNKPDFSSRKVLSELRELLAIATAIQLALAIILMLLNQRLCIYIFLSAAIFGACFGFVNNKYKTGRWTR